VAAGETVVVLESMKMELDVSAPRDGVVAHVDVAVGDHVQRGQVLAAVEEEDEA
jgi:biotin carboxyl carrier protein